MSGWLIVLVPVALLVVFGLGYSCGVRDGHHGAAAAALRGLGGGK